MDTPGLLLNREYYLSSTFLRSLRLVPLSLQSLVRCTSSISSFGETLSFTEGERERERESETKRDAYRIPRIGFLFFFFFCFENSHFPRIDRDWVKVMSVGGMDICRDFLCRSSYAIFFLFFYYYYYYSFFSADILYWFPRVDDGENWNSAVTRNSAVRQNGSIYSAGREKCPAGPSTRLIRPGPIKLSAEINLPLVCYPVIVSSSVTLDVRYSRCFVVVVCTPSLRFPFSSSRSIV